MKSPVLHDALYLNVTQVAHRYGVSTDTIWRWCRNGDFPSVLKLGPSVSRWKLTELEQHEQTFRTGMIEALWFDVEAA